MCGSSSQPSPLSHPFSRKQNKNVENKTVLVIKIQGSLFVKCNLIRAQHVVNLNEIKENFGKAKLK